MISKSNHASVLVTGASGFLGRHLVRTLLEASRDVIAITHRPEVLADLSHPRLTVLAANLERDALSIERGATVVHLAALRVGAVEKRERYLAANRDATLGLATMAFEAGICRFINVSTAMVLGPSQGSSLNETAPIQEFARRNAYIASKLEALEGLEKLAEDGFPLVTLFPTIVYGPDHPSSPNRITSHVRRLLSSPVRIHIDNAQRMRSLVFVDDVIEGILQSIDRPLPPGSRFLLGGEDVSMHSFEELVLALSGRKSPALRIPGLFVRPLAAIADILGRRGEGEGYRAQIEMLSQEWRFDSRRAEEYLGYNRTPLRTGLQITIQSLKTT